MTSALLIERQAVTGLGWVSWGIRQGITHQFPHSRQFFDQEYDQQMALRDVARQRIAVLEIQQALGDRRAVAVSDKLARAQPNLTRAGDGKTARPARAAQ